MSRLQFDSATSLQKYMTKKFIYNADEIFEEIPGDPESVLLKIPPELAESIGWQPGDTISVTAVDQTIELRLVKHGTNPTTAD